MRRPILYISHILKWADAYSARMRRWPTRKSGYINETLNDTWMKIDQALIFGQRGLRPGSTLARLLMEHRGLRHPNHLPPLSKKQILNWADRHQARTGRWPTKNSGRLADAPDETWKCIHHALFYGRRGWPDGSSLARFLQEHRQVRNNLGLPRLTVAQILTWADDHFARTGKWPTTRSGAITGTHETWRGVHMALVQKGRGLKEKSSLAALLAKHRDALPHLYRPRLTLRQIWTWLCDHKRRTGRWPAASSGPIPDAPGETWSAVDLALRKGYRGLRARGSLAELKKTRLRKRSEQRR